jgi:hypothetical protein
LFVEAEQVSQLGTSVAMAALVAFLCSPILALAMTLRPPRDVGRDTVVLTPLRVSAKHHRRLLRSSQRALKRWLKTVPVYAQLLKEYPRARVVFDAPGELKSFRENADQKPKPANDSDFEL